MITTHETKTRLAVESVERINDDEHPRDAVVYPVSRQRPRAIRPVRYRFSARPRDTETYDERHMPLVTAGPGVVPDAEAPNGPGVRVVSTHPVPPLKTPRSVSTRGPCVLKKIADRRSREKWLGFVAL